MSHKTVVRNKTYQVSSFVTVERHNERKNQEYFNGDVELERANLNVHFKQHFRENGEVETYHETFNRLLAEKKIVKHGTKPDAKLFCELVYDINTMYFEERGGYEFAKKYFKEAYRQAVKEIGGEFGEEYGEQLVISAVMHADEKNSRLSEQLGRDVYHYHLHVVYVPVVKKDLYYRRSNNNPNEPRRFKETIPQISQSNKWPLRQQGERDGKIVTLNSYSFLQDRYYEHMKAASFDGFERGERGSTTEHLEVLDYKIQQDRKHLAVLGQEIEEKSGASLQLDSEIKEQEVIATENEKHLADLNKKIKTAQGKVLTVKQIEDIPVKVSRPILGGADGDVVTMPKKDWDDVKKTALAQAQSIDKYQAVITENVTLKDENFTLEKQKSKWRREKQSLNDTISGLQDKITELENGTKQDFLERAKRDAELHNLKNDVAKIPKDIWDAYVKSKSLQKNCQKEVR